MTIRHAQMLTVKTLGFIAVCKADHHHYVRCTFSHVKGFLDKRFVHISCLDTIPLCKKGFDAKSIHESVIGSIQLCRVYQRASRSLISRILSERPDDGDRFRLYSI